jgi:chloramphenicol-sensitive protein RarD
MQSSQKNSGYLYAFLAYFCWGFFPIYWKFLKHVPLMQILAHRVLWAFVFYTLIIWIKDKKIRVFKPPTKKVFLWLVVAAIMLMSNWLLYIYAVNSNQVIESSLGYFINPIVNILLGVFFLKEKLSKTQIIASVCAAIGVVIIALDQGHMPLIALVLALTFSLYGLIKKTNPLPSLQSNQFESFFFVIPALIFISMDSREWLTTENQTSSLLFLLGSGLITGLPLLFFSEAAKKIPYYMMGFFQFLAPSLQFICGVFLYNEPLSKTKIIGFSFIWMAAIILAAVGYLQNKFILQKR